MFDVEKTHYEGPMRIGFGQKEHHDALRRLFGCVTVWTPRQVDLARAEDLPHPLREDDGDVAVMIRPTHFDPINIRWLATTKCEFEVPGHEPRRLLTMQDREDFRALKLDAAKFGVDFRDGRGAKPKHKISEADIAAAIKDWHEGEDRDGDWVPVYKLSEVVERMKLRTGSDKIKDHWIRDQVKKRFGSAARKPPAVKP